MSNIKFFFICLALFTLIGIGAIIAYFYPWGQKTDTDIPSALTKTVVNVKNKLTNQNTPLTQVKHIFVIVEENHDWKTIYNNPEAPFINNALLKQGAYASNYHNVPVSMGELHPSELNYVFMQAGTVTFSDHAFTTDDDPSAKNSTSSTSHLTVLLDKKGLTWKSYQEGISGNDCPIASNGNYAPKHNAFLFFQDVSGNPPSIDNAYCKAHVRPLSELKRDLASGNVPNYVFITPNLQNDMHNGTIAHADTWLSQTVPLITNSSTYQKDGALFITWDEGSENKDKEDTKNNNPIGMIMLSPFIKKGYTNTTEYSHASFLKTVEEIFSLTPLVGLANDPATQNLSDFFLQK